MTFDTMLSLACLTGDQREVLIDRCLLERSHQEIAKTMGVSRRTVQNIEKRATALMRLLAPQGAV